jgi:hypothetical protein
MLVLNRKVPLFDFRRKIFKKSILFLDLKIFLKNLQAAFGSWYCLQKKLKKLSPGFFKRHGKTQKNAEKRGRLKPFRLKYSLFMEFKRV